LIQRFIEYFTLPDDTVLDLCSGTGTTSLACLLSNRNCISIEMDEVQFLLMPTRLTQAQSRLRLVINDDQRVELDKDEEL
jgi:DNA modification methylase